MSNEEKRGLMEIAKSLEDSGLLIKGVTKEWRGGFLSGLWDTLGANIFGNVSAGRAGQEF